MPTRHMFLKILLDVSSKGKARGYHSIRNLKAIIYPIAGKLELALPT